MDAQKKTKIRPIKLLLEILIEIVMKVKESTLLHNCLGVGEDPL